MRDLLLKPLVPLLYSSGAVGLSFLWYTGLGWVAFLIVVCIIAISLLIHAYATSCLPERPVRAVELFNWRPVLMGVITASGATVAFILGIEWAVEGAGPADSGQIGQTKDAIKELAQTSAVAVGAYITALTVQAVDVDTAVGKYVKKEFLRVYSVGERPAEEKILPAPIFTHDLSTASASDSDSGVVNQADAAAEFHRRLKQPCRLEDGKVVFQPDSLGAYAISETSVMGLTDWSLENRLKRAEKIEENLRIRA